MDATIDSSEECGFFEGYSTQRFIIIMLASIISSFGTIANIVLVLVIGRSLHGSVYLTTLVILDCLLCANYVLLFGVDAGFVYLRVELLFIIYHLYIIPVFVASRIVQFAMPYMMLLATLERFIWTVDTKTKCGLAKMCSEKSKYFSVIAVLLMSILLRLPVAFALQVKEFSNCPDFFRSLSIFPKEWVADSYIYYIYDFYIIAFAQTLMPFVLLLILNALIICRLGRKPDVQLQRPIWRLKIRKNMKDPVENVDGNLMLLGLASHIRQRWIINNTRGRRNRQLRYAIYTMVAIVTSYLISNSLHLLLTVLERSGSAILLSDDDPTMSSRFYIAFSDTVSFCYMFTSAIRIYIYMKCNPMIREDVKKFFSFRQSKIPETDTSYDAIYNRTV